MTAMEALEKAGGFNPAEVSPEKAVAERNFAVLLIRGTRDSTIPCRHAERIYHAAMGPKQLWIVDGAGHASALGHAPQEYEDRVIQFFERNNRRSDQVVSTAGATAFSATRRTGGTASKYRKALAKHSAATTSKAPA